jgi:hypothetical protein
MTLVFIICEGPTEKLFMEEIVRPSLPDHLHLKPILIGQRGKRGGSVTFERTYNSVINLIKERNSYVTTFIDLYGLGKGWPERSPISAQGMEKYLLDAVVSEMGNSWNPIAFYAHVQPYEFESLLFSDPVALARGLYRIDLTAQLGAIRSGYLTPEDINNSRITSPSHRIAGLIPGYEKPLVGNLAALEVGLPQMELECTHFAKWLDWLRTIP